MIITSVQAGEILGVTERRVRQMVQAGTLKSQGRFGATVAVDRSSVLKLKAKRDRREMKANGKVNGKSK